MNNTICFFNTTKAWGGGEKWHFDMASMLHERGYDVLCIVDPGSAFAEKLKSTSLPYITANVRKMSFLNGFKINRLATVFKKWKVSVVILNLSSDLKTGGLAARRAGVPNIIYRRGSAIPIRNSMLNRYLLKEVVTHIIANSEETKRTILYNNPGIFDKDKIRVIYNGIDLHKYDKQKVNVTYKKQGSNALVIGNAGRMVKQKGQKMLIDIAIGLEKRNIDFKLLIAGDGKLRDQLEEYAKRENVIDRIDFLGFVKDVKSFMNALDIFLLTSLWEGFGYVLTEAMAASKPVVAFDNSSNPEIVDDEETGFLIKPYDIDAFVEKIIYLQDSTIRNKMGMEGRNRVEKYFTIEKTLDNLEKMIEDI